MTPFLQLILTLAILILVAKIGGFISLRLGQPSVLGELLVGVLLGPSLIDLFHQPFYTDPHLEETIHLLAEIGVMLLMFLAGLELHLADLTKAGKVAMFAGILGVIFPLLLCASVGYLFSLSTPSEFFVGLILSATSVSISAQTLIELKMLRSRVGYALMGAAVFDDILVILLLSIFSALIIPGSLTSITSILMIILRMVLFLSLALGVGLWLLPNLSRRIANLPISQGVIAFTLIIVFLYGWFAEIFGNMAAITGAFLAGLILARSPVKDIIENGVASIGYSLFVPIFFINIGLSSNFSVISGAEFWLMIALTVTAVLSKVIGAGLGAKVGGLTTREALQLGVGMMSRGEVGLIVASVGLSQGLIDESVFSIMVEIVIITTLITPPALRFMFKNQPGKPQTIPPRA
jgi:Kef-type K+ transport system membrane component KefB